MRLPFTARRPVVAASAPAAVRLDDTSAGKRTQQGWQKRAWQYRITIPEVNYASQFYARALRRIRIFPLDETTGKETTDERFTAPLAAFTGPGGIESMQAAYGRCVFVAGEGYTLERYRFDDSTGVPIPLASAYEFVSNSELRLLEPATSTRGAVYERRASRWSGRRDELEEPAIGADPQPGQVRVWRSWTPDPEYSDDADSALRPLLGTCEELYVLTAAVRVSAWSRMSRNGLLIYPNQLDAQLALAVPAANANEEKMAPFMRVLSRLLTSPILDPEDVSAVIPGLLGVPQDLVDKFKMLSFSDASYPESTLRQEARERLGVGLDMPQEVLSGKAGLNHWTGWLVSRDAWEHIEPYADQMVYDWDEVYYQAALARAGITDSGVTLSYDASRVTENPDRGKDAKDALDRYAISLAAYRKANGWEEDDAMPPDEQDRLSGLRKGGTAGGSSSGDGSDPGTADAVGPPNSGDAPDDASANAHRLVLGAAAAALVAARAKAGARVRTSLARANGRANAAEWSSVPNSQLAAVIGEERLRSFGVPVDATRLVAGGLDVLAETLDRLDVDPRLATRTLGLVEGYAAATLFDTKPEPVPPTLYWEV